MSHVLLVQGTALHIPLRDKSVHVCCTSPPYWALRSYGIGADHGELGCEGLHDCNGAFTGQACGACWICHMRAVFKEVWRILRNDGTLWLNCGDAYTSGNRIGHGTRVGYKQQTNRGMNGTSDPPRAPQPPGLREKNLLGMPWRLALALQSDGWILRSELIWHKLNPMPESTRDRPTRAHEQVFLFAKQARYFWDGEAVREPGALSTLERDRYPRPTYHAGNSDPKGGGFRGFGGIDRQLDPNGRACRSVLSLASEPLTGFQHYAAFPTALVRTCLLASCSAHGVCRECSAPWRRVVEREHVLLGRHREEGDTIHLAHGQDGRSGDRKSCFTTTTGWSPTCTCGASTMPATVFDPFCGSGTVPLVARELGHHGVGLDLSYPYLATIARERLGLAQLAAWEGRPGSTPPATYTDLPLFAAGD